jgi:hypothetical protein
MTLLHSTLSVLQRKGCLSLLACALALPARASAGAPELSERQIDQILVRSEKTLRSGRALQALRAYAPADQALFEERTFDFPRWKELSARARSVGWTCVVRLKGSVDLYGDRVKDPRSVLVKAEARLRELLPEHNALYVARHAESLVALGDHMPEAFEALRALHDGESLEEPESYAALSVAAKAIQHEDVAAIARAQCVKLSKGRAQRVCPK